MSPATNKSKFLRANIPAHKRNQCSKCGNDLGKPGACRAGAIRSHCGTKHKDCPHLTNGHYAGHTDACLGCTHEPNYHDTPLVVDGSRDTSGTFRNIHGVATNLRRDLTCNNCGTNLGW